MDVSIIIVNYNTIDLILDSIDSILEKTKNISFEILIVDNNSADNSRSILAEKYNGNVIYISLSDNIGFGRANNEGIKIAKGRNIFLLNPDTILINNAIKVLSDFLDADVNTAVCGGNLFDEKMLPTHSFRRIFPSIVFELNDFLCQIPERLIYGKNREYNFTDRVIDVAYITGADFMIKRSIIEKVGSFNPIFFMYYEETELCWRINKAGFKIKSVPEAMIQHLEGGSTGNMTINKKRMAMLDTGRNIFYSLCYPKLYIKLANWILFFNIKSRISIFSFRKNVRYTFWKNRLEFFKKLNW